MGELESSDIPGYLAEIGWPSSVDQLQRLLDRVLPYLRYVAVDLDVTDSIAPRVGLRCYPADYAEPGRQVRWEALLRSLVEWGLCTSEKCDAVLAFPGCIDERTAGSFWPASLHRAAVLIGPRLSSLFVRSIHHVSKLTRQPGEAPTAKVYLSVDHHWYSPTAVRQGP